MTATRGRVVRTPTKQQPYKVILEHAHSEDTEHAVSTVREGENLIKAKTPRPPKRDRSRDAAAEPKLRDE
ncbi:MAG: hypothetical protein JWN69_1309 [Alphaproteobacteria bacterium]|nr:hypothetical protein [Alphaproteobacteria bacterium]